MSSALANYSSNVCKKAYEVDIILREGVPWFKGCEVAKILGYGNSRQAIKSHVKPKYTLTREALGHSELTQRGCPESGHLPQDASVYISEPGLYSLILRSKKPEAEAFADWVVEKVLPEIRAEGSYKSRKPYTKLQLSLITEFDLHVKLVDFIKRFHQDAIICPGLGENQINDQLRIDSFRKGYQRGQPDLLILNRHKKWTGFCIEIKTPACTGVVSPDQQRFLDRLECAGYKVLVSSDYDALVVEVQNYFKDVRTYCKHCDRWVAKKHTHPEA